jgi:squalene-hopene/tetraprenyl-beta-curcumene cyclase
MDPTQLDNAIRAARSHLLGLRTADGHWTGELSSSALSTATATFALAIVARETGDASHTALIRGGLTWLIRHQNADGGWGDTTASASNFSATVLAWAVLNPADPQLLPPSTEAAISASPVPDAAGGVPRRRRLQPCPPPESTAANSAAVAPTSGHATTPETTSGYAASPETAQAPDAARAAAIRAAESWLTRAAGSLRPRDLARTVDGRYGNDRTFSAPILTMCALAGRLGTGRQAWRYVYPLPFELAALPHTLWSRLRLPVVSYALPALIAIGQARHRLRPPWNPASRLVRALTRRRTLNLLTTIQPPSGGFLEAAPLTSFVTMSLAAAGHARHPAARQAVRFLAATVRPDGSWPIDTNLATWVTTLAVTALATAPDFTEVLAPPARQQITGWLLAQHHRVEHPYTHAPPGGWAWTDLTGGVPDADDTAGALVALRHLTLSSSCEAGGEDQLHDEGCHGLLASRVDREHRLQQATRGTPEPPTDSVLEAAIAAAQWLMDIQNSDGGIPTFCRGWGRLPFDRSSPDLTAHALAAWVAWLPVLPDAARGRVGTAVARAVAYLEHTQTPDGTWVPLWFGNEHAPREENPTYGTARVVAVLAGLAPLIGREASDFGFRADPVCRMLVRGANWLLATRGADGGWGGGPNTPASIEETALAVDALARLLPPPLVRGSDGRLPAAPPPLTSAVGTGVRPIESVDTAMLRAAVLRGAEWLIDRTRGGTVFPPAPIGFYFAKLWYFEQLYPVVFTVAALQRARAMGHA